MKIKNKLPFLLIISILICSTTVYAYFENNNLSMDEAIDIILGYHNIKTDVIVSDYLTLDSEIMTRQVAVTAVIRSFGIYPANEPNYIWDDEEKQDIKYQPYIDYALRTGITKGIGNNCFAPNRIITKQELCTMLERASDIKPEYKLYYSSSLCKLLSSDVQYGLSLVPNFLIDKFYSEGRKITVTTSPIKTSYETLPKDIVGFIYYEGNMWVSVIINNHLCYDQDMTTIHELGHFLGYRTKLLNRTSIPQERDWMFNFFRDYGNMNNQEFFADCFVMYILYPNEMKENMPTAYAHIEECLKTIENQYKNE